VGKKDFLLLSGALALLLAAPAALAEVPGEIIAQSKQLNVRENEGFFYKDAEYNLKLSTERSLNPGNIPQNSFYNFQELPASEFSLRSNHLLPSMTSVDFAENTQVRRNSAVSQYSLDKADLTPPVLLTEALVLCKGRGESDSPLLAGEGQGERSTEQYCAVSNPLASANTNTTPPKSVNLGKDVDNQLSVETPATPEEIAETPPVTEQSSPELNNFINLETNDETSTNDPLAQVTSVSQLSDVQPTDWTFSALQNLRERYGCIVGYSDGTFRGNRALTRFEFAAGLNACLTQIQRLIAASTADFVRKEDLATLQRLIDEFRPELTSIRSRVDSLDARTTQLENNQFSTTVILGGEVIFGLATAFGGNPPGAGDANTVFNHLTRLQLVTTFTGVDRLRLELAASNFNGLGFADPTVLNTFTSLLSYQSDTGNSIQLSSLEYRFAGFNNRVVFTLKPVGFSLSNVLSANSPYFDTGRGAISRFGEANPIFKIGALDAGIGFDWLLSDRVRLQFAYGASNGNDSQEGFLFSGNSNVMGAQLLTVLGNSAQAGLTLVYGYSSNGRLNTFTGSAIADASGFINLPSNIYAISGTLQWRLTPRLTFSTWGGLTATYAAVTDAFAVTNNFMFALGFSDPFGRRGDLLALMIGQPPRLIQVAGFAGSNGGLLEKARSLHLEAFYRFTVTDRISITPGFFIVTNPGNIAENNTIYIGTIRTTFRF
jgi:hypothetical protein